MPARRSLSTVPGAVHLNRAGCTPIRRMPRRRPRAAPLTWRLEPRARTVTQGPAAPRRSSGPCRRLPGSFTSDAVSHEDGRSVLRRWTRRRFD